MLLIYHPALYLQLSSHAEKNKEHVLFEYFIQANSLPTTRLITCCTHYFMPDIHHLNSATRYALTAHYEVRIRYNEMAEESLTQPFNYSLHAVDDNVSIFVEIQLAVGLKKVFPDIGFLPCSLSIVTPVQSSRCVKMESKDDDNISLVMVLQVDRNSLENGDYGII